MSTLILKSANEDDFFERGKRLAKLADAAKTIPHELVISFEEPSDLPKLLTATKVAHLMAHRPRTQKTVKSQG